MIYWSFGVGVYSKTVLALYTLLDGQGLYVHKSSMRPINPASNAIYQSLREGPLLVGDLSGAPCFKRRALQESIPREALSFDQKFGHTYEDALAALIAKAPSIKLIARNLQVFDDTGRTLGELDFVLCDSVSEKLIHLELAVKFYLGILNSGVWHFPGPDPHDNWQRKLERMQDHQFKLAKTSEACSLLRGKFGIDAVEARQLIYGRLFDPIGTQERPQLSEMAPGAHRGRWLYLHD